MMQLEGEYSMSIAEQSQHKQALLALERVLQACCQDHLHDLCGLTIKLYHPKAERLSGLRIINPELYAKLAMPEKVIPFGPTSSYHNGFYLSRHF